VLFFHLTYPFLSMFPDRASKPVHLRRKGRVRKEKKGKKKEGGKGGGASITSFRFIPYVRRGGG